MAISSWTLIDAGQSVCCDSFEFCELMRSPQNMEKNRVQIAQKRLKGGISDGIDQIELNNGKLELTVLPTRGMGIWQGRCGDVELKWNSPNFGPVHPKFVPVCDPSGLGWLEGFDEWLVRCGLESNGSPEFDSNGKLIHPLHGRIANTPARSVQLSINRETGEITLSGKIYETKLFFKKLELESTITTVVGSSKFTVTDKITNLSDQDGEFELLYHINTGQPFAAPGGRVVVPFDRMAPRTEAAVKNLDAWNMLCQETPGSEEVVFFFQPAAATDGYCKTMLVNPKGDRAMILSFKPNELPYFSFWKSRLSDKDGYVCGMEPSVNFPNTKSFEKKQGRVVSLAPGESRSIELCFEILCDTTAINQTEKEIQSVAAKRQIENVPTKEWSE